MKSSSRFAMRPPGPKGGGRRQSLLSSDRAPRGTRRAGGARTQLSIFHAQSHAMRARISVSSRISRLTPQRQSNHPDAEDENRDRKHHTLGHGAPQEGKLWRNSQDAQAKVRSAQTMAGGSAEDDAERDPKDEIVKI